METSSQGGTDSRAVLVGMKGGDRGKPEGHGSRAKDRDLLPRDLRHHSMTTCLAFIVELKLNIMKGGEGKESPWIWMVRNSSQGDCPSK